MSKTIQIYLPDGDPEGIHVADMPGKAAKVYVIPRGKTSYVEAQPGLRTPAVFFLFSRDRHKAYIGSCDNFALDGQSQAAAADWWHTVVVCTAGSRMEKADAAYMAHLAWKKATDAGRITIVNSPGPEPAAIHDFKVPVMQSLFADLRTILATLGFMT